MKQGQHTCAPAAPVCGCYMLADTPSEDCPIHGCALVNRCDCGRFVRPSFYEQTPTEIFAVDPIDGSDHGLTARGPVTSSSSDSSSRPPRIDTP